MSTIINTLDEEYNVEVETYRSTKIVYNSKWSEYRVTDPSGEVIYMFKTVDEAKDHVDTVIPARTLYDRLLIAARREGR